MTTTPTPRWNPDNESLALHTDLYGYALGAMLWGTGRMQKEGETIRAITDALGESLDAGSLLAAIGGIVEGYRRAYKQFRFRSDVLTPSTYAEVDANQIFGEIGRTLAALPPGENILTLLMNAVLGKEENTSENA